MDRKKGLRLYLSRTLCSILPVTSRTPNIRQPTVFLAGHLVRLRELLRWLDMQARFGKTVVVMYTRSQTSAAFLLPWVRSVLRSPPCRPMTDWYASMKTVTVVNLIVNKRPGIIA